jgi:hypothetical protein
MAPEQATHEYDVYAFCDECSQPHPTSIRISRNELLFADQPIGDIHEGRGLPEDIVSMVNNSFQCPTTQQMFRQSDNSRVFLVRLS